MGEGEKHKIQENCNNNIDGVLQTMEEINGWLYGYLGGQRVLISKGKVFPAKWCILRREGMGSIFLENLSHHMHASQHCRND